VESSSQGAVGLARRLSRSTGGQRSSKRRFNWLPGCQPCGFSTLSRDRRRTFGPSRDRPIETNMVAGAWGSQALLISDEGKEIAYTRLIRKMGSITRSRVGWALGPRARRLGISRSGSSWRTRSSGGLRPALGGRERAGAGRREALSIEATAALMSSQCPLRGPVARPRMRSVAVVSGKPYLPEVRRKPRYYRVSGLNVRWAGRTRTYGQRIMSLGSLARAATARLD
jgi:hypothetical protein